MEVAQKCYGLWYKKARPKKKKYLLYHLPSKISFYNFF